MINVLVIKKQKEEYELLILVLYPFFTYYIDTLQRIERKVNLTSTYTSSLCSRRRDPPPPPPIRVLIFWSKGVAQKRGVFQWLPTPEIGVCFFPEMEGVQVMGNDPAFMADQGHFIPLLNKIKPANKQTNKQTL